MPRKSLVPRVVATFKRTYSTDRNYSTAMGALPDVYEEEMFTKNTQTDYGVVPKPYSKIPGPKELPFIGNAWRFAPLIGKYFVLSWC